MKRKPEPMAPVVLEPVKRRWWQAREVQLVCACGWRSKQRWDERPYVDSMASGRLMQRIAVDRHFADTDHTNQSDGSDE